MGVLMGDRGTPPVMWGGVRGRGMGIGRRPGGWAGGEAKGSNATRCRIGGERFGNPLPYSQKVC